MSIKILAVSDQEVERLYGLAMQGHFKDVSLILACGDLPYNYLDFLLDALNVPLYYVPGNHDPVHSTSQAAAHVDGGTNLDMRTSRFNGLLLGGLGGCVRYRPDGVNQYTQAEMYVRAARLLLRLAANRLRFGRALDILVTHSPPFGIHDEETQAHRGLKAINLVLRLARPRFHLHGHTHIYRRNLVISDTQLGLTRVLNVYPYKVIEVPDE